MNLTVRQLTALVAVANHGSFTDAARQLHLTQSALSALVRDLEQELGIRMFDRNTRRVVLSEAGREFYPSAEKILQDLESAVLNATGLRDKKHGFVRVAAPLLVACTLMPPAMAAYRKKFPGIQIKLIDAWSEQVLSKVSSGEVDFGICPDRQTSSEITRSVLFNDPIVLVCPADHVLAKKKRLTWDDLHDYDYIGMTPDYMAKLRLDVAPPSHSQLLRPAYEVSNMTTALAMVSAGLGITTCPRFSKPLVGAYHLRMRPLHGPDIVREMCIFTNKEKSLSPAAESFLAFLHRFVVETSRNA